MEFKEANISTLKELYDKVVKFKELQCWQWLTNMDIFGVKDPESGEIGYCSVLGNGGIEFGISVFLGIKGLKILLQMTSLGLEEEDLRNLYFELRGLRLSFFDRKDLTKKDLKIIKELGLKFRGRNQWPQLRSFYPYHEPWYLTDDEAKFFTLIIEQAMDVALRFKDENHKLYQYFKQGKILVRVPEKIGDKLTWKDDFVPVPNNIDITTRIKIDIAKIEDFKNYPIADLVFEFDVDILLNPMREPNQRPYYPFIMLWIDHKSGFVLNFNVVHPDDRFNKIVPEFLNLFAQMKVLPKRILVRNPLIYEILTIFTRILGIEVKKLKRLKFLDSYMKDIEKLL